MKPNIPDMDWNMRCKEEIQTKVSIDEGRLQI